MGANNKRTADERRFTRIGEGPTIGILRRQGPSLPNTEL